MNHDGIDAPRPGADETRDALGPEALVPGRFLPRVVIPVALMVGMLIVSHGPAPVSLPGDSDKLAHALAYAALGGSWAWALATLRLSPVSIVLRAIAFSALWGMTDEFHQSFVPGRSASLGDALADLIGAAVGASVALWYLRRTRASR